MAFKWTKEQEKAITHSGSSVIVSAAAGSGKTAILVERIIRLLCDPKRAIPADKIVVVTFTNKAAGELRARLEKALDEKLCGDNDSEYADFLEGQRVALQDAHISTISSFCLEIIRANLQYTSLPAGFTILDETQAAVLRKKSLSAVLESFYSAIPDEQLDALSDAKKGECFSQSEVDALFGFLGGRDDLALEDTVDRFYTFTRNLPDIDGWIKRQEELYSSPEEYRDSLLPAYEREMRALLRRTLTLCAKEIDLVNGVDDKLSEVAKADYDMVNDAALIDDYAQFKTEAGNKRALELSECKWTTLKVSEGFNDDDFKKTVTALRSKIKDGYKRFVSMAEMIYSFPVDVSLQRGTALTLIRLFRLYERDYARRKNDCGAIDFSDIEQTVLSILRRDGAAERIGSGFEFIIVDEFQDSNDVQYEIFSKLSRGDNLFFVGDIKQSIYGFRGANPEVFSAVTRDPAYTFLTLSSNFRSSKQVVDSVNGLFERTMTLEVGQVDYDETQRLVCGTGLDAGDNCTTELLVLDSKADRRRGIQAAVVAAKIREMIDNAFPVHDKDGAVRPCRYSDFAIISRSVTSYSAEYEQALNERGIPMLAGGTGGYLETEEISLATDLLGVIANPYSDAALFHVLTSSLYMFDSQLMTDIRLCRENELESAGVTDEAKLHSARKLPLYSSLLCYQRSVGGAKVTAFLNDLEEYRRAAQNCSVKQLVRMVIERSGFLTAAAVGERGTRRLGNLRLLLHYAEVFGSGAVSLTQFLQNLEQAKSGRIVQAEAVDESADAVRLMTIHGSKGLEFPFCFVPRVEAGFNFKDNNPDVIFSLHHGIAMKTVDCDKMLKYDTMSHSLVSAAAHSKVNSEEMRMLYVAVTRAREKLFLVASVADGDLEAAKDECYLTWIDESGALGYTIRSSSVEAPSAEDSYETLETRAAEYTGSSIAVNINNRYKFSAITELPAKVTATQLGVNRAELEETIDEPAVFPRNPEFLKEKTLTGKRRGDAYHKLMELIDFGAEVTSELERLSGKFTSAELACIDKREIERFFATALGKRATAAASRGELFRETEVFGEIGKTELKLLGIEEMALEREDLPVLQGIADMYFIENGAVVLVDYKTNRRTSEQRLRREYSGQLLIYKDALEKLTGLPVNECLLYSFELGRAIEIKG